MLLPPPVLPVPLVQMTVLPGVSVPVGVGAPPVSAVPAGVGAVPMGLKLVPVGAVGAAGAGAVGRPAFAQQRFQNGC